MNVIPEQVRVLKRWLNLADSDQYFKDLTEETRKGLSVQLKYGHGKPYRDGGHRMGRWGDEGVTYSYKDTVKTVSSWTPALRRLRNMVEADLLWMPNCGVVNVYGPIGSLYPHRDGLYIPQLGDKPRIVSVSFGAARTMTFHPLDVKGKRLKEGLVDVRLEHGDLMIMEGDCDSKWHHSIAEEPESTGVRLSVTFRKHSTSERTSL